MSTPMDSELIQLALVVALLTGGLVGVLLILLRRGRLRAERLSTAFELGTSRPAGILASAVDGLFAGYSCRYQIQYASQYDRGGAGLKLAVASPHQWSAEVSKPGMRMLTRFGVLEDFEVGDRELDEHLRFAADDERGLRTLFAGEAVRQAMHTLAASENFDSIRVRRQRVDVRWSPRMVELDEDPVWLRSRLDFVIALVRACGYAPVHPNLG